MEKNYLINAIYRATEGEGVHIGTPQVFVRFQGCNIGCINCDSMDTWEFTGEMISLEDIWQRVLKESFDGNIKRVSITGGDPLHPKHEKQVLELVGFLKTKGFFVNIEAAGVRVVDSIFDLSDYISFDYKTPSTGVKTRVENIVKLNKQYGNKFQVKAVVADEIDFKATLDAYNQVLAQSDTMDFPWCLTPCYEPNEEFPMERFEKVQYLNESNGGMFRVIGQQHKWVYGPDRKEV
jgi:7-carboxy-7-deazaguanine synthase